MKTTLAILCALIFSISIHAQSLKKSGHAYFQFPDNVGILVDTRIRAVPDDGATGGGLVGGAISASINHSKGLEKYDSILQKIEPKVDPRDSAKAFFEEIYKQKGKQVTMLDLDYNTLPDFARPNNKWPAKDAQTLQEKYGINGLVHITLDYGMEIHMSYGIATRRSARCRIITEIITTSGNKYVVQDYMTATAKIVDGWNNPPDYSTLQAAIRTAIQKALTRQKELYGSL